MKSHDMAQPSPHLRELLRKAERIFVLTGAGVSAESGVPTFRGGGQELVWKGLPFSEISSARMVREDLPAVWEWFDYRRNALQEIRPNPAHEVIARWAQRYPRLTLVTQNIDDLHRVAGSPEVLELHGNIWRARCTLCGATADLRDDKGGERPPRCRACGGAMRPDVVLFGEMLPGEVFEVAAERARQSELCLVIGTSAVVYPAALLPEMARAAGAYTVEINPEPTSLGADEVLRGKAGEILPRLES